ncbi:MAG: JAB domain-containing protein [Acholeplasma sp.]|jgi:DNA repair protein RadC|nr:MAG: JAB domain-containing protein [Acholeplasma sp.]
MYMLREMPKDDRPRERLLREGPHALSTEELMAILLRTGRHDLSVMDMAKQIIYHLETLDDLKRMSAFELMKIEGIKEAKACTVIAAIELGKRLSTMKRELKVMIRTSTDVYHYLSSSLSHLEQEHFIVLYLNIKSEVITKETIFMGTINQTLIHPREILKTAIKLASHAILCVHNHPTGDSTPSKADVIATKKISEAAEIMGIDLIDHLIIGQNEFYSIREGKKTFIPL